MQNKRTLSRRTFLKTSTLAAAGLATAAGSPQNVLAKKSGWSNGMRINPDIDNLRVVACRDPNMENEKPLKWDQATQNKVVNAAAVSINMDAMACALTQLADAGKAWASLLRKPDSKSWKDVKAAIKVNCAAQPLGMHPRAAIIDKLCKVLNGFGVSYQNITLYDAVDVADSCYAGFKGTLLPADIVVSKDPTLFAATDFFPVTVSGENMQCTTFIQNCDILINLAINKPHNKLANITMCCKNHVGTIVRARNNHGNNCPVSLTQLFDLNKHEAIIGTPAAGVPCRQQLCIVDSLWASNLGSWDAIPNMPLYYLVMGTFAPAVDYIVARKIRGTIMGCSLLDNDVNRFITDFGYSDKERQDLLLLSPEKNAGRGWVEVPTVDTMPGSRRSSQSEETRCALLLGGERDGRNVLHFSFPGDERILNASVYAPDGRLVRRLAPPEGNSAYRLSWDQTTESGSRAGNGAYYLHVRGPNTKKSVYILLK
jgi:hypothetical protein